MVFYMTISRTKKDICCRETQLRQSIVVSHVQSASVAAVCVFGDFILKNGTTCQNAVFFVFDDNLTYFAAQPVCNVPYAEFS